MAASLPECLRMERLMGRELELMTTAPSTLANSSAVKRTVTEKSPMAAVTSAKSTTKETGL